MKRLTVILLVVVMMAMNGIFAMAEGVEDSLERFVYGLSSATRLDEVEPLAKACGLFVNSKSNGIGGREYRIAKTSDVAKMNSPEKGSVVTMTFNLLSNDKLTQVSYFDETRMIAAYWTENEGYTMIDFNNPVDFSGRKTIDGFEALRGYHPMAVIEDNLLEWIFTHASESITQEEAMSVFKDYGLSYNPRGAGNEQVVAYDYKVHDKYGDDGNYLVIDFANGYLAKLEYHDYVVDYWDGCYPVFYAPAYPYSDYKGFFILGSKDDATAVENGRAAIDMIKEMRLSVQRELGYAE